MKLTLTEFNQITTGAVRIEEEKGVFSFRRFTKEQEELYRTTKDDFYDQTFSTSGIKFRFRTDSKNLYLKINTAFASLRKYFSVDVLVNNSPIGYIDNFSNEELEKDYTTQNFPDGEFEKNFDLGYGTKEVYIHLPWSVDTKIKEISLDDGAFIEGIKPNKKLLCFGDSITHGYDALRPSNRYASKLAEKLNAEEFNKGIGGERFFPPLSELKEPFVPDYITVAYGTNDWRGSDEETFKIKCREFYKNISNNYPNSIIFAISPIWRKDNTDKSLFGPFENVEKYIKEIVSEYKNIVFVPGFDFVPKDITYFADLRLHPNDEGFVYYTESLYNGIKAYI